MSVLRRRARLRPHGRLVFAMALGVSDGILNALTLASATVVHGSGLTMGLGARVGTVSLASAVLTLFVAEYAQLRLELVRAERQLMFTQSGRLAATSLGRTVIRDSAVVAVLAGMSSFAGAALPLVTGALLPRTSWVALIVSGLALALLGILLARNAGGRWMVWATSLVAAGVVVTVIGIQIDLV